MKNKCLYDAKSNQCENLVYFICTYNSQKSGHVNHKNTIDQRQKKEVKIQTEYANVKQIKMGKGTELHRISALIYPPAAVCETLL